jgi:prepilin-type N-terminal cleavage/methylation domain-containing protein
MSRRLGQQNNDDAGFTLFELLIVIVILAILAGIVTYAVGTSTANALTSSCASDAKTVETAVESYKAEMDSDPPAMGVPGGGGWAPLTGTSTDAAGSTVGPFLRSQPSTVHYRIVTDGNGNVYVYPPASTGVAIPTGQVIATQTITQAYSYQVNDGHVMNFDTNPGVCADPNVVM